MGFAHTVLATTEPINTTSATPLDPAAVAWEKLYLSAQTQAQAYAKLWLLPRYRYQSINKLIANLKAIEDKGGFTPQQKITALLSLVNKTSSTVMLTDIQSVPFWKNPRNINGSRFQDMLINIRGETLTVVASLDSLDENNTNPIINEVEQSKHLLEIVKLITINGECRLHRDKLNTLIDYYGKTSEQFQKILESHGEKLKQEKQNLDLKKERLQFSERKTQSYVKNSQEYITYAEQHNKSLKDYPEDLEQYNEALTKHYNYINHPNDYKKTLLLEIAEHRLYLYTSLNTLVNDPENKPILPREWSAHHLLKQVIAHFQQMPSSASKATAPPCTTNETPMPTQKRTGILTSAPDPNFSIVKALWNKYFSRTPTAK